MFLPLSALFRKLIQEGTLQVADPAGRVQIFGQGVPEVAIRFHSLGS
jgi:hypothetical protein